MEAEFAKRRFCCQVKIMADQEQLLKSPKIRLWRDLPILLINDDMNS
jgi:hypothetical protein